MSNVNAICNTTLAQARTAGQSSPLIAELVERFAAELRFEEVAQGDMADDIDLTLHGGRSGPHDDHSLLALIVAAGPHSAAVEALTRTFAGIVAEHDAYERMAQEPA
jgi:hypothetical protein